MSIDRVEAETVAQRLRDEVTRRTSHGRAAITISVGVTWTPEPLNHLEDLLLQADEALYAAKAAGRDRVVLAAA